MEWGDRLSAVTVAGKNFYDDMKGRFDAGVETSGQLVVLSVESRWPTRPRPR